MWHIKQLTNKGKTVVSFSSHGCQGTIHEFEFVGVIVGSCRHTTETNWRARYYAHEFFYKVKVIVSHNERVKEGEIREVPHWYCTEKDGIVIHVD